MIEKAQVIVLILMELLVQNEVSYMFREIPYDFAMKYIIPSLEAGGVLSNLILDVLKRNESMFSIMSFLSEVPSLQDANFFRRGGLVVKEDVSSYLFGSLSDGRIVVIDDVMAGLSDIQSEDFEVEIYKGEIFHVINGENGGVEKFKNTLFSTSVPWHQLILIVNVSSGAGRGSIVDNICSSVGKNTIELVEVIVGAFDGEGYIHLKPCSESFCF